MSIITGLQNAGYHSQVSAKGRYMQGLVPLLGGQFGLDVLRHPHILRLFSHAQFRKGQAYTLKEMTQIAAPAAEMSTYTAQIQELSARGALIRGYRLQCPLCDLDAWYPLDTVGEIVRCEGCRTTFQLPLHAEFAFRPNRLLLEGLKSGALTVLLTLYRWLHDSPVVLWQSCVMVERQGESAEIDLIVQREDGLWMAECKDHFETDTHSLAALQSQLERSAQIARGAGATFVFATLLDDAVPADLRRFLTEENILLLDRAALLNLRTG